MVDEDSAVDEPIVIKKYANRRLYNASSASFVTLNDLHEIVKRGQAFVVHDEKSGRDITTSVLAQIIADEEIKGHNIFPHEHLRQVLKAYSDGVGPQLATYLEQSMAAFATHQLNVTRQMQGMFDGTFGMERLAEVSRRNLEEFGRSIGMFTPQQSERDSSSNAASDQTAAQKENDELMRRLSELEERLDALSSSKPSEETK